VAAAAKQMNRMRPDITGAAGNQYFGHME
jgi:hypothetical protein